MGIIEKTIEIKASPEKVWEMLALDMLSEWMFFERVEYTSEIITPEDKYRVGATAHGTPNGGELNNCYFEITDSLENEKITYRLWEKVYHGISGGLVTSILEPMEGGTRFTYEFNLNEIPWGILGKIISPLIMRMGKKDFDQSLKNLKYNLEK